MRPEERESFFRGWHSRNERGVLLDVRSVGERHVVARVRSDSETSEESGFVAEVADGQCIWGAATPSEELALEIAHEREVSN
jgi:hypothetical protein